jgi:hypothetical protein
MDRSSDTFDYQECLAALRGEKVPRTWDSFMGKICVVRGIRSHPGFATELLGSCGEFTRALHARAIMSGSIPDMKNPDEFPYCIWYPAVASEGTYRELARRYPQMRYLVGRACAVAGYAALLQELDLLPEVHIAEEARDNGHMGIFEALIKSPIKYAAMSDYDRTMQDPPRVAHLNGDTAVRSLLDQKVRLQPSLGENLPIQSYFQSHFNITEDHGVDETEASPPPDDPSTLVPLLYTPLPLDLPAVNKDLLIAMAAYYGDVDRYARLRRPGPVENELPCIIHGIYTNTMFAKWWSLQLPPPQEDSKTDDRGSDDEASGGEDSDEEDSDDELDSRWYVDNLAIIRAITARFIMVNDLSRVSPRSSPYDLPYNIWYPIIPVEATLEELVRRRPDMKPQAARACIAGDFQSLYEKFNPDASQPLLKQAELSRNDFYQRDLRAKAEEGRGSLKFKPREEGAWWHRLTSETPVQWGTRLVRKDLSPAQIQSQFESLFEGQGADPSIIELNVCLPEELKKDPPSYLQK